MLVPRKSIIWKLFKKHADPFMRIMHGLPMSWDPSTAISTRPSRIVLAAWSQCSQLITIVLDDMTVEILDVVTLQQLQTLEPPEYGCTFHEALIFSPDGQMLTYSGHDGCGEQFLFSWDLHTGGIVSAIHTQEPDLHVTSKNSITYSMDGEMVGVFYWYDIDDATMILTYNVISGIHIHSHVLAPMSWDNDMFLNDIWTHGESLQFATIRPAEAAIVIWEVGFTSETTPTEVETFSIQDNLHPTLYTDYSDNFANLTQILPTSY